MNGRKAKVMPKCHKTRLGGQVAVGVPFWPTDCRPTEVAKLAKKLVLCIRVWGDHYEKIH